MSFANLKKNSQNSSLDSLQKKMEELGGKGGYQKDERFWTLERDKSGNGMAVIRFLPAPSGEDFPLVRLFSHGFKGPKGGWFIENCPTTLGNGRKCPVCEANNELWNSGIESNKKIASDRKRKLSYISNILVISDPANPSNEGKVFLFRYGKKIFDKLEDVMDPEDPDDPKIKPFDFWKGANFKLKAHIADGNYVSYDKSGFSAPTQLFEGDDAKLEALYNKLHPLKPFITEDQFKSYEELTTRFSQVMKATTAPSVAEESEPEDFRSRMSNKGKTASQMNATELGGSKPPQKPSKKPVATEVEDDHLRDESEEDSISYFRKLAEEDE